MIPHPQFMRGQLPHGGRRWLFWGATCVALFLIQVARADADLASNYFVGTYRLGAGQGVVTVQLVERLPGGSGYIGWTTIDGLQYLGNIFVNGANIDVTWYAAGGHYQIPLGTIQGTISPNGQTINGRIRQGLRTGRCTLHAS